MAASCGSSNHHHLPQAPGANPAFESFALKGTGQLFNLRAREMPLWRRYTIFITLRLTYTHLAYERTTVRAPSLLQTASCVRDRPSSDDGDEPARAERQPVA